MSNEEETAATNDVPVPDASSEDTPPDVNSIEAPARPTAPVQDWSNAPQRPALLKLMGYPHAVNNNDYTQETLTPDWDAVLDHLMENPSEASYHEDGAYPLDDALWIEEEPVPSDVVIRLLRLFPNALSEQTFEIASQNPNTFHEVMRLLRAADVDSVFTFKRTKLVRLMGFPPLTIDQDYEQEDVVPDWEKVRLRLVTHPKEASVDEEGCYPIEDAVWIQSNPVPLDIAQTLLNLCPESLTDQVFENASENEDLDEQVLRLLFRADKEIQEKIEESFVKIDAE
jgi:hypothetical protein